MMNSGYKQDFDLFNQKPDYAYLDHAATALKPEVVIDAIADFYRGCSGSPHRGAHVLSVEATALYDKGRARIKSFIDAGDAYDVVFTKNASEALNFVFKSYLENRLKTGDEVVLSVDAHHSLIVPAQEVCRRKGAVLKYLYVTDDGQLPASELEKLTPRTVLVAVPQQNNALGNVHDIAAVVERAHAVGAVVLVDGAQAIGHQKTSLDALDFDFYAFSGHKLYGPQGIGALVAKTALLETCVPFLTGGDTIDYVTEQETTFAPVPERFEAGTQNVAGVVGLTAAIDYVSGIGLDAVAAHEHAVASAARLALAALPYVTVIGRGEGPIVAFTVDGVHPHDVASILDAEGVAIRAGHHCAQPLMHHLGLPSTCRVSFSLYSDTQDVEALVKALEKVKEVFALEY